MLTLPHVGRPPLRMPPLKKKKTSLFAHLQGLQRAGAFRAGVGRPMTGKAPGRHSYGAGAD